MTRDMHETLSAYLDGELPEAEMAEIEARLLADPEWQAELDRLIGNDQLLEQALRAEVPDAVDEETARRFGLATAVPTPIAANDHRPWAKWLGAGGLAAAAAALVLVVRTPSPDPWEGARFNQAMMTAASMQQVALGEGNSVTPLLSFRAADGRYCREFRLAAAKAENSRDGIACRTGGAWKAEVLVAGQPTLTDPGRIEVAGGGEQPELDRAYDRLGADAPMSADEERRLIANGWTAEKNPNHGE